VVLLDLPPLLRQILAHAISEHPDLELLPEAAPAATLVETGPVLDAVIVGADAAQAAHRASVLLDRWPKAQVVVVTAAGRDAALYELRPHATPLGRLSPGETVQAIRDAVWRRRPVDGPSM
jgi:hypothetical protein